MTQRWRLTMSVAIMLYVTSPAAQTIKNYRIGEIPPLSVIHGRVLQVFINSEPGSVLTVTTSPTPRGRVILIDNRIFRYEPANEDKTEFTATFAGRLPSGAILSQAVRIHPFVKLPPEHSLIISEKQPPADTDDEFVTITEHKNSAPELFNHEMRSTRSVSVSAQHLILDGSRDQGALLRRVAYDPVTRVNSDIKELNLYADTIEIKSTIRLPQTTVRIYCRVMQFRDDSEAGVARIDTTPLPFTTPGDNATAERDAEDGKAGANGGNIELYALQLDSYPERMEIPGKVPNDLRTLEASSLTIKRLIMRGGDGQAPGDGLDAIQGTDLSPVPSAIPYECIREGPGIRRTTVRGTVRPPLGTVWVNICGRSYGQQTVGQKRFPDNATPAKSSGKPGVGGDGGTLVSNLLTSNIASQEGGISAAPGKNVTGARGGLPRPAYHTQGNQIIDQKTTIDAPAVQAPIAATSSGNAGGFRFIPANEGTWLHPFLVAPVLRYAKRVYLNGHLEMARRILASYSSAFEGATIPQALQSALGQQRVEIDSILLRISNNVDYFGNPAGWVPLLSLESYLTALDNEINASIGTLYLSYWIEKKADNQQKDEESLRAAIQVLNSDLDGTVAQYQSVNRLIPDLQREAAEIESQITTVQSAIRVREDLLLQRAVREVNARNSMPIWKQGLRVLSTACKVIPVYQPVLGGIGGGLDVLTDVDVNTPLKTFEHLTSLSSSFSSDAFRQAQEQLNSQVARLERRNARDIPEYVRNLAEVGRSLAPAFKAIRESLVKNQAPKSEVDAELQRLKAQSPELADLVDQVAALQGKQAAFAVSVSRALSEATQLSERINATSASVVTMQQNLSSNLASIDHAAVLAAKDMEERAFDRLLKYQYFVAKAFEYRFLSPYPGQIDLEEITRRLRNMLGDTRLENPAAFDPVASAYRDSIRQVIQQGIDRLSVNAPDHRLELPFGLEDEELQELNTKGSVTIDLRQKLQLLPNEEDRRIAAISVDTGVNGLASNGIEVITEGAMPATSNLRLLIEHFGESTITRAGKRYAFHFGSSEQDSPFTWGAALDLTNGRLTQETMSLAGLSLLRQLIPRTTSDSGFQWFVEPAADAKVTIKRVILASGLRVRIVRLRLAVGVNFYRASTSQVRLTVRSSGAEGAVIKLDRRDLAGLQDGRSEFQRLYTARARVRLVAPTSFGTRTFVGWFDDQGSPLATVPELDIPMTESRTVVARFQ